MNTEVKTTSETLGLELNHARAIYLEDLLPWFETEYKIHELISDFWGIDTKARLVAVTRDIDDKAWKGLVSEWDTNTSVSGQFRLNKPLIEELLKKSLGDNLKPFKLKSITPLELSIFENFFVNLENFWQDYWRVAIPNSNGTFIYLIWAIELNGSEIGSLAIGVPPGIAPKKSLIKNQFDFRSVISGLDVEVPIDLTVGKSKIKISDIKEIESGDLIVFENSNVDYLTWEKSDMDIMKINTEIPAKDNSRFSDLYYDELEIAEISDSASENMNSNDDLLTDLPVELTAQFKSVQMPLQKIVELESGGILPLGLLMDSKLTLVAPGDKPIASGNLVVVGNQFGIKIDKTNIKKPVEARINPNALNAQAKEAPPKIQQPLDARSLAEEDHHMEEEESFSDLDQELEDIGIDPKELDELEDLY